MFVTVGRREEPEGERRGNRFNFLMASYAATKKVSKKRTRCKPAVTTPTELSIGAPLPTAERSESISGVAVLPPGSEETWPHDKLFLSDLRVSCHSLFHDPAKSSVMALGGVLTEAETQAWRSFGDSKGFERAFHREGNGIAYRDCGRISVEDEGIAAAIFMRIRNFLPPTLDSHRGSALWTLRGCSSNLRLYKYGPKQRFGRHYDESVQSDDGRACTFFTVLLYLNGEDARERSAAAKGKEDVVEHTEGLRGGNTNFFHDNGTACCSFSPRQGFVLLHEHGDRCLLHEGAEVKSGFKYLLRTDVIYKRDNC